MFTTKDDELSMNVVDFKDLEELLSGASSAANIGEEGNGKGHCDQTGLIISFQLHENEKDAEIQPQKVSKIEESEIEKKKPEVDASGFIDSAKKRANLEVPLIFAESPISYNRNFAMTEKKSGFICIPRSLLEDPLWRDLPPTYQAFFYIILEHLCFKPRKFDDHGVMIDLKVGQLCASRKEMHKWCGKHFDKNIPERAIDKFVFYGFLSQEVSHRKSILTLTHRDTYNAMFNVSESGSESILSQSRVTKEQSKQRKQKKDKSFSSDAVASDLANFFHQLILKNKPNFRKPNLSTWAKDIRRIIDIDKREPEQIKALMTWVAQDNFESKNVLSPGKLRDRLDQLEMKSQGIMKSDTKNVYERLKKVFVSGEEYNQARCNLSQTAISFDRGMNHRELKFSENGFWDQFRNMLNHFGIQQTVN